MSAGAKAAEAEVVDRPIERWMVDYEHEEGEPQHAVLSWLDDEAKDLPEVGEVLVRYSDYLALPDTLDGALLAFQRQAISISKDKEADTGKFKYKYTSLDKVLEEVLPIITDLGLLWKTKPGVDEQGRPILLWRMKHLPSGESEDGIQPLMLAAGGGNPQDLGKALTYARRYALVTYLNIAAVEDADGVVSASQGGGSRTGVRKLTKARADEIYERCKRVGNLDKLQLAATHIHGGEDVGSCNTKPSAIKALQQLSAEEGERLMQLIERKEREALGIEGGEEA